MDILKTLRRANEPPCAAVLVAAGESRRMQGVDKLTAELGGQPLLFWSLRAFEMSEMIRDIFLVVHPDRLNEFALLCAEQGFTKLRRLVAGGATRTESVLAGLKAVPKADKLVAIHDAARPLVTVGTIEACLRAALLEHAAAPALPLKDTVKRVEDTLAVETPDRASLMAVQTPQCFDREMILAALQNALDTGATLTDDCSAVERIGMKVRMMPGDELNFKITTPLDLRLARMLVEDACESDTDMTSID